jgi:hypothetical protein
METFGKPQPTSEPVQPDPAKPEKPVDMGFSLTGKTSKTACGVMVRKGSSVRVRWRALQPRAIGVLSFPGPVGGAYERPSVIQGAVGGEPHGGLDLDVSRSQDCRPPIVAEVDEPVGLG